MQSRISIRSIAPLHPDRVIAALGVIALTGSSALAGTPVGGPIFTDTVWSADQSPYCVVQSVVIGSGATLTIAPGTIVEFEPGLGISVGFAAFGEGSLVARGTADAPILFTSSLPADEKAPGDWNNVLFTPFASDGVYDPDTGAWLSGSSMEHCVLEYAGGGSVTAVIDANETSFDIVGCEVRDSLGLGLYFVDLLDEQTVRAVDCTVRNCRGGLTIDGGIGHSITGSTFEMNGTSGGVGLVAAEMVEVVGCTMTGNGPVPSGGGLVASGIEGLLVEGCTIAGNYTSTGSSRDGGGAWISSSSTDVIVRASVFEDNTCGDDGGGLWTDVPGAMIEDCTFEGNSTPPGSTRLGGGVYAALANITITGCSFVENEAGSGGGLYLSNAAAMVDGCTFVENDAISSSYGGAYIHGAQSECRMCTFDGNTAAGSYGGLRLSGTDVKAIGLTVIGNTAGSSIGGLYVTGTEAEITDCVVSGNTANSIGGLEFTGSNGELTNVTIEGNEALTGAEGGADIRGSNVTMTGCTIDGNAAATGRGGLTFSSDGGTIDGCVIRNNSTDDGDAGGLYLDGDGVRIVRSCIEGNVAGGDESKGGGIFVDGADLEIDDSRINGNAAREGGGLYVDQPGCTLTGDPDTGVFNQVANNTLTGMDTSRGAAIYNDVPFDAGGAGDVDATYLCWGTTDQLEIQQMVWDFFDESSRGFVVTVDPVDCGPLGDLDGDGVVSIPDLLALLAAWGDCPAGETCPADLDCDGSVGVGDLLTLLGNWS